MAGLPLNFLDMLVRFYGQSIATFQAASFQDITSAFGGHALAEAVHTHAAALFRLVSSFRHTVFLTKVE
jgi:hypothetical protein